MGGTVVKKIGAFVKKYSWTAVTGMLIALAAFFRFAMRGYAYIAYALAFFDLLIVARHIFPVWLWRVTAILVCLGLVYFIIVEIPIIKNSRADEDCGRPYLVVLGAAVHGDVPSLALTNRMRGALEYLNENPNSVVIASGGQGKGENKSEAQAMYDWFTANGVAPERIIMEDKSTSTLENLKNSFAIIRERGDDPEGNVTVVSSAYHLYRAKLYARMLGVEVAGFPGKWDYPIATLNYYIREAFGVTYLWILGK